MQQVTSNNQGYKRLVVWQKAHRLVLLVYSATKSFPKEEVFGLTSQMRRCAVSVPANIVEGYGRKSDKEKLNFFNIAKGSLTELEYYIELTLELGYINEKGFSDLVQLRSDVGRLLNGFSKSYQ